MSDIKMFTATKAFITYNGKVLIIRESKKYKTASNTGRYDVVGGKVEPGQRFDESLLREIREEIGKEDVVIGRPFFVNEWRPVVHGEQWQIIGTFFECVAQSDQVTLGNDHDDYQWIDPKDFRQYNIIENIIPVFEGYLELKK